MKAWLQLPPEKAKKLAEKKDNVNKIFKIFGE